ncbi:hypothetical protein IGI04_010186 [Brassica rapa subsp. trilocularis]|uniref:Uncharacterized protein n=1 Tax=Brassica rapa subsp. trilocularis TaxID=1813537 RepID=A0ABQ7MZF5_BRACM|nr:hypothetical protein IGI04_010186 [Brassica rapa subsp. trilocularis]
MASTQIVGFDNMERMSLNNCSLQPRLGSRFVNKDIPTIDTRLLELAFQSTSYGVKESWFVLFVRFIDETIYN